MFDKLSDELREQREKSNISLQQLANKTRIDIKFLEAIEQGNFAFLPELYVKAFIKQYAKTVGLNEDLIIKKYEAAKEGKEYNPDQFVQEQKTEETVQPESIQKPIPKQQESKPVVRPTKSYFENPLEKNQEESGKSNKNNLPLILSASAVVVVLVLVLVFLFNSKNEKIVVEETPIEDVVGQSTQRYEEEPSTQTPSDSLTAPIASDSLYLTFTSKETSWIYVISDDKKVNEFTLSPNSKFTVASANNFKVTVGNSGGVSLQLNNQPVEFAGRSGSVRHFKLDRTGLVYLNAPPKLEQN